VPALGNLPLSSLVPRTSTHTNKTAHSTCDTTMRDQAGPFPRLSHLQARQLAARVQARRTIATDSGAEPGSRSNVSHAALMTSSTRLAFGSLGRRFRRHHRMTDGGYVRASS
jgi:hypothetical protein